MTLEIEALGSPISYSYSIVAGGFVFARTVLANLVLANLLANLRTVLANLIKLLI